MVPNCDCIGVLCALFIDNFRDSSLSLITMFSGCIIDDCVVGALQYGVLLPPVLILLNIVLLFDVLVLDD